MCDLRDAGLRILRGVGITTLAAALLVAPDVLVGQTRAEVAARIDGLLPLYREAEAAVSRADSLRALGVGAVPEALDTVAVGPFLVIAFPSERALAEGAFRDAWDRWGMRIGEAEPLEGAVFAFDYGRGRRNMGAHGPGARRVHVNPAWFGPDGIERAAEDALLGVVAEALPPALTEWAPLGPLPTPARLEDAYRALARSRSRAARACFTEGGAICWDAAGVTGATDEDSIPLSRTVRGTLLGHALEMGEAGAVERLLRASTSAIPAGLSAAAGVPPDSLIDAWHARVVEARPRPAAGALRAGLTTILWLLVLALLAMRSTPWRSA